MTKIVLASDFHIRYTNPMDHVDENGVSSRLNEILDSLSWAVEIGKQHKANIFISTGDVFDTSERLPTKEGLIIQETFKKIKENYKSVFFIPGNHDIISNECNILTLFEPIIKVFSNPSYLDINGARLFFLPYVREPELFYSTLEEFKKYNCFGKKYLFAHFWDSSVVSLDSEAIDLNKADFNMFDKVFSGHYHSPSINTDNKIIYCGTLLNKKFNERGQKGAWILNCETEKITFYPNPLSPTFVTTKDISILNNAENLLENAYYKVECSPENILEVSKLLSKVKGYEIVSLQIISNEDKIILDNVERKNTSGFKNYILNNCKLFLPEGVTEEEFKNAGTKFMENI